MFDNTIAAGQIVLMVVAMRASDVLDGPGGRRSENNLREFEAILLNELPPLVRKRYRIRSDPRSWRGWRK
jgi:hypothetical protein